MIIKKSSFEKTSLSFLDLPDKGLKEIVLSGRSNVGKSSFINSISNNNKLARISKKPGKTVTLNYYLINDSFYFVDTPGYGFARKSDEEIKKYSSFLDEFSKSRETLSGFIILVDSRITTKDDYSMVQFLKSLNIPFIVVMSKIDKLKRNDIQKRKKEAAKELLIAK